MRACNISTSSPLDGLSSEVSTWCECVGLGSEGASAAAGAGKEVLLARLVEQLKARLQAYKEENQQLEEMLHQSDTRASSEFACEYWKHQVCIANRILLPIRCIQCWLSAVYWFSCWSRCSSYDPGRCEHLLALSMHARQGLIA